MAARVVDLQQADTPRIEEVTRFLYDCFRRYSPMWLPDLDACHEEVQESFLVDRRSRILIDETDRAVGWIGAITDENVWEIHPIAVAPTAQRRGYGKMLVDDIMALAKASGAVSVWAGTSDETGSTSFSKVDLYGDPAAALTEFDAPDDHPIHFWLKAGFSLVGVMPDEEGLGKPGIHFARRID